MERGCGGRGPSTSGPAPPLSRACSHPLQNLCRPVLPLPSALCGHLESGSGATVGELLGQLGFQTPVWKAHGALPSARRGGAQAAGLLPCLRGAPGMLPGLASKLGPAEPPGGPSARDSLVWPGLLCPASEASLQGKVSRGADTAAQASWLWSSPGKASACMDSTSLSLQARAFSGGCGLEGGGDCGEGCWPLYPVTARPRLLGGRWSQSRDITLQTQLPPNLSGRTGVLSAPQEHIAWVLGGLQTRR